ncbi:MAG: NifB/NifX family molybdenum-iron cluster-binding protein [Candidatus Lokiarchaeota archaeon]
MVIIAIPSFDNGGLNSRIHPKFGRCESFTFITIEKEKIVEVKTILNHTVNLMGGMGVRATQIIRENKATIIIAKRIGPNALESLKILNIKILKAPDSDLTIKEVIRMCKENQLDLLV